MITITKVHAYKEINSRGDWTVVAEVILSTGVVGRYAVADGASTGTKEAIVLDTDTAVSNIISKIAPALVGLSPYDQLTIDTIMLELDKTPNKATLGGNSILAVSVAVANACALSLEVPAYIYLHALYFGKVPATLENPILSFKEFSPRFPIPLFNILNGGKHAQNNLSFQEFMIIPSNTYSFLERMEVGVHCYHILKDKLHADGYATSVGDEGGFAPSNFNPQTALAYIQNALSSHYIIGTDIYFGIDVAADSFVNGDSYTIKEQNLTLSQNQLIDYLSDLTTKHPLIILEDPLYETHLDSWNTINANLGSKLNIVGDDLVVTNTKILLTAIDKKLCNAVIVKLNQVGTLTETFAFIQTAQKNNLKIIISHRSGDTAEDTFVADMALAVNADFVKFGAPARGERTVKYNRLLEIYDDIQTT
ncbi:MAG: phosphopyruvate hydratase [Patescibacteria group bacterium]|uniref:Enolase n=1 Tax=candidate division WWE3 bacterium TaxID=2053526 RepID=A0A955EBI2_UNCKA|nr:phosphopyruvate hydratase [candidate division WWE3 bacterium]